MALWVVDQQPARRVGLPGEAIADVARALGHEVVVTDYDPSGGRGPEALTPELGPVLAAPRPIVLRGSVGFAAWAHAGWPLRPGAFPSARLAASAWLPAYGDLALNAGAEVVAYAEFEAGRAALERRLGGALFVKPADGGKRLAGTVLAPGRPLFDAHYAAHRRWAPPPDDYRLLVAPVRPVAAEWRFVVAGRQVAAASRYKTGPVLDVAAGAPDAAWAAAAAVARHPWRPADVFVADVAETDGGYRLVELNTFGTAGLYACDLGAVVRAVAPYAA